LKERLYEENQIDHVDYLAALTGHERYLAIREEMHTQMELLKVNINTLIGKCEETNEQDGRAPECPDPVQFLPKK